MEDLDGVLFDALQPGGEVADQDLDGLEALVVLDHLGGNLPGHVGLAGEAGDGAHHGLEVAGQELEDLVNLAVNGEVQDPASALGEHVNDCWPELVGPADRSLVHWLRRLVFRSAWLDQRVKEGELDIVFDEETHTFGYVQPERDREPIELSPEPNWARVAYSRR